MTATAESEDALLAEWRATYPPGAPFCPDGMVSAPDYGRAPLRVAVVLRETNGTDPKTGITVGFDVRAFLREGPRYNAYLRVARWVWAAQNGFPSPEAVRLISRAGLGAAVRAAAVVNLKKISGGPVADIPAVAAAAERDRDLLQRQIALLDPHIVIAGGTWENALSLVGGPTILPTSPPIAALVGERLVIGFDHPSVRASLARTYAQVPALEAVKDWLRRRAA